MARWSAPRRARWSIKTSCRGESLSMFFGAVEPFRPYTVVVFDVPARGQVVMQEGAVPKAPSGGIPGRQPGSPASRAEAGGFVTSDAVQIMIGGPPSLIGDAEARLRPAAFPGASYSPGRNTGTQRLHHGHHESRLLQGRGAQILGGNCDIPASDVMAMGDNFNDLEMLEIAGQVVMGESHRRSAPRWLGPDRSLRRMSGVALRDRRRCFQAPERGSRRR